MRRPQQAVATGAGALLLCPGGGELDLASSSPLDDIVKRHEKVSFGIYHRVPGTSHLLYTSATTTTRTHETRATRRVVSRGRDQGSADAELGVRLRVHAALELPSAAFTGSQARKVACGSVLEGGEGSREGILAFVCVNGQPVTAAACYLKCLHHHAPGRHQPHRFGDSDCDGGGDGDGSDTGSDGECEASRCGGTGDGLGEGSGGREQKIFFFAHVAYLTTVGRIKS